MECLCGVFLALWVTLGLHCGTWGSILSPSGHIWAAFCGFWVTPGLHCGTLGLHWGTLGAPSGSLWGSIWMTLGCPWPKRSKSQKRLEKVSWSTPPGGAQNPLKIDAKTKGFKREAQKAQSKRQRHRQSADLRCLRSPNDFAWKAPLSTKTPNIIEIVSILATILDTFLDTKKT